MLSYCLGFVLSRDKSEVLLIRKNRPSWQQDKLNGVGGKVEFGESFSQGMVREFYEETGVQTEEYDWTEALTIEHDEYKVVVFYTLSNRVNRILESVENKTDEPLLILNIDRDWNQILEQGISNLPWILCFLRDEDLHRISLKAYYE